MNLPFLPKLPLSRVFPGLSQDDAERRWAEFERSLIKFESEIGGKLFGPIPKGHHRRFFCLDRHTWIWHEEWQEKGQTRIVTTRYDVRPGGILKSQNGQANQRLSPEEAANFYRAVHLYQQRVDAEYQRILQSA